MVQRTVFSFIPELLHLNNEGDGLKCEMIMLNQEERRLQNAEPRRPTLKMKKQGIRNLNKVTEMKVLLYTSR
jgi:hypothetical protein